MFEPTFLIAAAIYLLAAAFNLVLGLMRRVPASAALASMILVEIVVLFTLVIGVFAVASGQAAKRDTVEFFVYAITATLIPLAGVAWTLVERNRWGSYIYALVGLTSFVMLTRMHQLWFGV